MAEAGYGGVGSMSETANAFTSGPLDLNSTPVVSHQSTNCRQMVLRPSNSNLDGDIEFEFPNMDPMYLQMVSCRLFVAAKIVRGDGEDIDSLTETVFPINLMGPSLFSAVNVELQHSQQPDLSTNNFPYKCYLETLLTFGSDANRTHLPLVGFYPDSADLFDNLENNNLGAFARKVITRNGRRYEMVFPLLNDFLRCEKQLIPRVFMKVTLSRSHPKFYLMATRDNDYSVKLVEVSLTCNYIENTVAIYRMHQNLHKNSPVRMPFTKVKLQNFDIPENYPAKTFKILDGALPKIIIVGMVESAAYHGAVNKNPFRFQHFYLEEGYLRVSGEVVPARRYKPDFSEENPSFYREYSEFLTNIGLWFDNAGCFITPELYGKGCFLMAFDLTSDRCAGFHHHEKKMGTVDLELVFRRNTEENITVITYSIYDACAKIDADGSTKLEIG